MAALCAAQGQFALLLDEQFDIVWHTATLTDILGYETVVGRNGLEFLHADDVDLVLDALGRLIPSGGSPDRGPAFRPDPANVRVLTAAGTYLTIEAATFDHTANPAVRGLLIVGKVIIDRSDIGRSIELLGTGADVSEVLPLIARLSDRAMGGDSRSAIAWWRNDDVLVTWSPDTPLPDPRMAEAARFLLRAGVTASTTITDFAHPMLHGAGGPAHDLGYTVASLVPIVAPVGEEVIGCLLSWSHSDADFSLYPQLPLHVGLRIAALAIMDSRVKSELRWTASHDPLTSLMNRARFGHELAAMESDDVALLYIDLDDFKPINDVHGHPVGDAVLIEVAGRMLATVGTAGVVGRLGGDEFAIACPGLGDVEKGWAMADRVVEAIRRPVRIGNITVAIGASIGVAMGAQPLIPAMLIQRADEALLAAKFAGKNTVMMAD